MADRASEARPLALITGASAGIGAAFARAYAARGYDLALSARRADRLEALAAELAAAHGIEAFAIPADLAVFEAHAAVLAAVSARGRTVDALVNNAGFSIAQSFVGGPWTRLRDCLMTLVVNACVLAYGVNPGMVERRRGTIVNLKAISRVERDHRDQPLIVLKHRKEPLTVSRTFAHLFKAM